MARERQASRARGEVTVVEQMSGGSLIKDKSSNNVKEARKKIPIAAYISHRFY